MDPNKYYKKRADSGCWGLQTLPLIHAESQEGTVTWLHDTPDPEVKLTSWWGSSDFLQPPIASKSNFNCRTHCAYLTRATENLILSRWQEPEGRTTVQTCGPWGKALSAPQPHHLHLTIPSRKRININGHCEEEKSGKVKGVKGGKKQNENGSSSMHHWGLN